MDSSWQRTPLYAAHLRSGARMVPFGGWEMPLHYQGILAEHRSVRERAGVIDVSHMGEFLLSGPAALEFLQWITPNDLARLRPGRAQYNWLPNAQGGLVDDVYIYCLAEDSYLMVVNAANIRADWDHLNGLAEGFAGRGLTLQDLSAATALLAVQGPRAASSLQEITDTDLSAVRKNGVIQAAVAGWPVRLARTGYTGEDGFELFCPAESAEALWAAICVLGVTPAGLGARDTLRLEAGFPLYGHEFRPDRSPLTTHYGWVVKDKPWYAREALLAAPREPHLVGLLPQGAIAREGSSVYRGDELVGEVSSGTQSPSLGRPIAMAFVRGEAGPLEVEVRGRRVPAQLVRLPFWPPSPH